MKNNNPHGEKRGIIAIYSLILVFYYSRSRYFISILFHDFMKKIHIFVNQNDFGDRNNSPRTAQKYHFCKHEPRAAHASRNPADSLYDQPCMYTYIPRTSPLEPHIRIRFIGLLFLDRPLARLNSGVETSRKTAELNSIPSERQ